MQVVEQDERRLLSRLQVAEGGVEVRGPCVQTRRRRASGGVQRRAGAQSPQGFADDAEGERRLHGLSAADADGEITRKPSRRLQHARLAETGLALRRRRVLLHELENLTQLIASKTPHSRVRARIKAADRLLDASLSEASRTGLPPPREAVVLDLDPAVQSDLRRLRAEIRNETPSSSVSEREEGGR